jgi:hypothetical protein
MRQTMPFDTHSYVKKLVAAGVPEAQAEIHAQVFGEVIIERLATKDDLQALRADLRGDLKDLELRMILRFGAMLAAAVAIMVAAQKLL